MSVLLLGITTSALLQAVIMSALLPGITTSMCNHVSAAARYNHISAATGSNHVSAAAGYNHISAATGGNAGEVISDPEGTPFAKILYTHHVCISHVCRCMYVHVLQNLLKSLVVNIKFIYAMKILLMPWCCTSCILNCSHIGERTYRGCTSMISIFSRL